MLNVRAVKKQYGDHVALLGVDLSVERGEICALLGPNGAGKSTLVGVISGLRRPDEGNVEIDGRAVWPDPRATRELLGLAPQDLGVYLVLNVRENLKLFGELAGLRGRELDRAISDVAEALELGELLDRQARHLSGGEQRRVHTAMAMVHRPQLLLLDEPTTGVDVATRSRLLANVRELAATNGVAVLYSTHYLAEVSSLNASVVIIDRGRVLARGSLESLIASHGSAFVEFAFDGAAPEIAGGISTAAIDGQTRVRIASVEPAKTVATTVSALGDASSRLRGIEITQPDLESVFLKLTGRRFRTNDEHGENDERDELKTGAAS